MQKCNSSSNYKSKFLNLIFSPKVSEIGILYKNFIKLRLHSKYFPRVSEIFLAFSNTSEDFRKVFENFQKVSEDRFENFPAFSDFFRRLAKISEDFRQFPTEGFKTFLKMLEGCFKHFATISKVFRRFPKTSEDFRRLLMISEDLKKFKKCWKVVFSTLRHLPIFSEDF